MNTAFFADAAGGGGSEGAAPSADRGKICRADEGTPPAFPPLSALKNWHGLCDQWSGDKAFLGRSP
jgi:hypothetical protein